MRHRPKAAIPARPLSLLQIMLLASQWGYLLPPQQAPFLKAPAQALSDLIFYSLPPPSAAAAAPHPFSLKTWTSLPCNLRTCPSCSLGSASLSICKYSLVSLRTQIKRQGHEVLSPTFKSETHSPTPRNLCFYFYLALTTT